MHTIVNAKDRVLQKLEDVETLQWISHLHYEINLHRFVRQTMTELLSDDKDVTLVSDVIESMLPDVW